MFITTNQSKWLRFLGVCLLVQAGLSLTLQAQNNNNTVAVVPFSTSFSQSDDADYSKMLTETILSSIAQSQRFMMVDVSDLEKTVNIIKYNNENPQDFEGWANVSDAHLVEAGKRLGIEYIFTGNITNVSTTPSISGLYRAEFGFTIKSISVETGRIYVTETFAVNSDKGIGGRLGGKDSKREALNAALQNVNEPVRKFIDKYFPVEAKFYRVRETEKNGSPKTIIISGGLAIGLRQNQTLDIVINEVDEMGATYRNKIGEAKIIEIEGNFSTCKVLKGAEALRRTIEENKENIFLQSQAYK